MDSSKNFILITPCKNEGQNLPSLIDSIIGQSIRPIVWIILDDGSTDNTPIILKEYSIKYKFINIVRFEESSRDIGLHLSEVMKRGFDYAINYCKLAGLEYHYLGNVDGDLILPYTFFENLITEFEKDQNLGIASGGTDYTIGTKKIRAKVSENEPSGGHMLIRRECFEDLGRLPNSYSMDSVIKAKARIKGWKTKRFESNIALETRGVSAAEGYFKGSIIGGKSDYYINYNPIHVLLKGIRNSLRKPHYRGIAYIWGYFSCIIERKKQVNDEEIRNYFWHKWKEHFKREI